MSNENAHRKRRPATLWLLIALCVAPVVASYLAYYVWRPSGRVNYGELLRPKPLPGGMLTLIDGRPFRWHDLAGRWVMAMADSGRCDAYCEEKLVYLRQVRLAQGKEMDRIERVWLLTDDITPPSTMISQFQGTRLIRAAGSELLKALPAPRSPADHIYIIDPLGNLMMRYPRGADPRRIVKDVERLLKVSGIG